MRDEVTGKWNEQWVDMGVGRARGKKSARDRRSSAHPGTKNARGRLATRIEPVAISSWPRGERVYFVAAPNGLIKIGISRCLEMRWRNLCSHSPVPLELLGSIPGSRYTEQILHDHFAADRQHGEWFKASDELLGLATGELVLTATGLLPKRTATSPATLSPSG